MALDGAGARGRALRVVVAIAVLSRLLDEPRAALSWGHEARGRLRSLAPSPFAASIANELGLAHLILAERELAREAFSEALALGRAGDDRFNEAVAASNLCLTAYAEGQLRQALACYGEATALLAGLVAPALEGAAWTNTGRLHDLLGEPDRALAAYREAEGRQERAGDRLGAARTRNNLGVLYREGGNFDAAQAALAEALATFEELGERRWQARVLNNLGRLADDIGRQDSAAAYWRRALTLCRQAAERRCSGNALTAKARAERDLGAGDTARAALNEAILEFVAAGDRSLEADARCQLGELRLAGGELLAPREPPRRRGRGGGDGARAQNARRGLGGESAPARRTRAGAGLDRASHQRRHRARAGDRHCALRPAARNPTRLWPAPRPRASRTCAASSTPTPCCWSSAWGKSGASSGS